MCDGLFEVTESAFHLIDRLAKVLVEEGTLFYNSSTPIAVIPNCFANQHHITVLARYLTGDLFVLLQFMRTPS